MTRARSSRCTEAEIRAGRFALSESAICEVSWVADAGSLTASGPAVGAAHMNRKRRVMVGTQSIFTGLWLALLVGRLVTAQASDVPLPLQDLAVRTWSKEEGLPDNSVMAVLQTQDGYLWVGTQRGLARFDGVRFVAVNPARTMGEAAFVVTALCEDSAGRLWVGTQDHGLFHYDDGVLVRFAASGLPADTSVNAIAEDPGGFLWVGTSAGLIRMSGDSAMRFTVKEGLPHDAVSNVSVARSGTVWITTIGGMSQYKGNRLLPVDFQADAAGRSPGFLGVYEDRQGNLWAFGDTYLVNLAEGKRVNYFRSGDTSSVRIWSLCESRNGQLWIGTSGQGLFCFAGDRFLPLALRAGGVASDVRALCEDREGNLWLGTRGDGLVRLQPRNGRVLTAADGIPPGPARLVTFDAAGKGLLGFGNRGLFSSRGEVFSQAATELRPSIQNLVASACAARDGTLWIGTLGAGLYCKHGQQAVRYTMADGLSDEAVLVLAESAGGAVWAGTRSGSLHRFEGGKLTSFGRGAGLPGEPVTAMLPDAQGALWIGTEGGVLLREVAGQFGRVTSAQELAGQPIRALHADATGRLWIGAGTSLACLHNDRLWVLRSETRAVGETVWGILTDTEGNVWYATGASVSRIASHALTRMLEAEPPIRPLVCFQMGVLTNTANQWGWPRAAQSVDGRLWFATPAGVVVFNPTSLKQETQPPAVLIESVLADGVRLSRQNLGDERLRPKLSPPWRSSSAPIRLGADLRSLEIQYTAPYLSNPETVQFRHKLDGFDVDWVEDGPERRVRYGRLPNGDYQFQVRASSTSGLWPDVSASFSFVIPTPLWRTGWAIGGYGLAVAAIVAAVVRWASHRRLRAQLARLAQQEAMQKERMRIAQDMHDDIGSKLTKISFMSERARGELRGQDPVAGKLDAIATTSRDLLKTLDEIVWAVNPRNDDLEHLAAYLGQYATEYFQNTAVECEVRIPRQLPSHPLSAELRHNVFLAFEEALNNVLKHAQASVVRVNMALSPEPFEITITDNGRGFDVPPVTVGGRSAEASGQPQDQDGLHNLRQRLADVGGQCQLRSEPGQGTTVSLRFPLTRERAVQT